MTLRHLKIFVAVYQEMSITKASVKLHLAQPSVSLAIRELEDAYGIRLFDRINRRLFVTEKGVAFYQYAKHIADLFDEMEHTMISPDGPGSLQIGSSITIGNFFVPGIVKQFHETRPNCEVMVKIQNSQQIVKAVQKNELDLGLVEDKVQNEQLAEVPFFTDRLSFICGKNHPLAGKDSLTLEELTVYPFFLREPGSASREITDSLLRTHQLKCRILWESASNQALIQGVKDNTGITVLSEKLIEYAKKEGSVVTLPLQPKAFIRSFSMIYHKKKYCSENLQLFMNLVLQHKES